MNVRFTKSVSVDYEECRTTEIYDKYFRQGQILRDVGVEPLSKNFANIHLVNGDLAMSVPTEAFQIEE